MKFYMNLEIKKISRNLEIPKKSSRNLEINLEEKESRDTSRGLKDLEKKISRFQIFEIAFQFAQVNK